MNKTLGYILVDENNNALMLDEFSKFYYHEVDLFNDIFKTDVMIFKNEYDKNLWIDNLLWIENLPWNTTRSDEQVMFIKHLRDLKFLELKLCSIEV